MVAVGTAPGPTVKATTASCLQFRVEGVGQLGLGVFQYFIRPHIGQAVGRDAREHAPVPLQHARQKGARQQHRPAQVDPVAGIPDGNGHILHRAQRGDSGVVQHNVHPPALAQHAAGQPPDAALAAHVGMPRTWRRRRRTPGPAEWAASCPARLSISAITTCAPSQISARARLEPDPAPRAGDHGHLPGQRLAVSACRY